MSVQPRKPAALKGPSLSSLLTTPTAEAVGIPIDCPVHKRSSMPGTTFETTMPFAIPGPDITPLSIEGCYSCLAIANCYSMDRWQRSVLARGPRLMVDTCQLRFPMHLEKDQMEGWVTHKIEWDDYSQYHREKHYQLENSSTIHLTYYPNYYKHGSNLFVRFSLPKVLHGSNLLLLPRLEHSVQYLALLLNSLTDLPEMDPWQAILSELHVAYNHPVGSLAPHYVSALRNLTFPHRKTTSYLGQGVMYSSNDAICRFYDKAIESNNPSAVGLIRQEAALKSKGIRKVINKYTGEEKTPTLLDVTEDLMAFILEKDQANLRILNHPFGTADMARKLLCDNYGPNKGMRLYGYLLSRRDLGTKNQVAHETGCSLRVAQKMEKLIAEVGLPAALTDSREPLPPLTLPNCMG